MMRLKVASSLLMAEYIQAEVQAWQQQPVDLLVASLDDAQGQVLLHEARQKGLPVLAITRKPLSALSMPGIAHGASVREMFQRLRELLLADVVGEVPFRPRTLFHSLGDVPGKPCLLHMGLVKLLVDAGREQVIVLRDIPYENCLKAAVEAGWTLAVIDADTLQQSQADAVGRHPFEDFCWRAAALADEPLLAQDLERPCQLRAWPEVETGRLPVQWLLPMAAMTIRPWRPAELALATGAAQEDIARIMAAAACTGLLDGSSTPVAHARTAAGTVSGFFSRIAKRFGLNFSNGLQV
ncbi:hypothetical protein [Stenotrophomonas sp. SY1]|uniref:hypothetical protein n=1 Tax=Stenotrophomonas sp. SY1 TaxID=477235 RepID=UPI001E5A7ED3|nr:hypothetical protein [Stenotrophomonas sp. SY1]MCD9085961.1 hypothetical protein [Stenotrophomonas sp. SY1]